MWPCYSGILYINVKRKSWKGINLYKRCFIYATMACVFLDVVICMSKEIKIKRKLIYMGTQIECIRHLFYLSLLWHHRAKRLGCIDLFSNSGAQWYIYMRKVLGSNSVVWCRCVLSEKRELYLNDCFFSMSIALNFVSVVINNILGLFLILFLYQFSIWLKKVHFNRMKKLSIITYKMKYWFICIIYTFKFTSFNYFIHLNPLKTVIKFNFFELHFIWPTCTRTFALLPSL